MANRSLKNWVEQEIGKIPYYLYANTRLGLWYHRRQIKLAKLKHSSGNSNEKNGHHSAVIVFKYGNLEIIPLPCGEDNYCYIIKRESVVDEVILIDVTDGDTVRRFLDANHLTPLAVLTTHKHWDHCAGNKDLRQAFPNIDIYGSQIDKPYCATRLMNDKDAIEIGSSLSSSQPFKFTCMLTPGHTKGHMVYLLHNGADFNSPNFLFCGDLIFYAGMGKIFEEPAEIMLKSLNKICELDGETVLCPGHEYGKSCIIFAALIDKGNIHIQEKMNWVFENRRDGLPALFSTLNEQKSINPFLRTDNPNLLKRLLVLKHGEHDENTAITTEMQIKALMQIRKLKDGFRMKTLCKI